MSIQAEFKQWQTANGNFNLHRRPLRRRELLQAWDAADSLLIEHVNQLGLSENCEILVVNDDFGALCTALSQFKCSLWSDSATSHIACADNCNHNGRPQPNYIASTEQPSGDYALIVYKLPKSRSLLEFQLSRIAPLCSPNTQFVGAAMAKHIDSNVMTTFTTLIGAAKASLAHKKARLIHVSPAPSAAEYSNDSHVLTLPEFELVLENRANVFSRNKLDQGSRVILECMDELDTPTRIADLGCGNGLLGIVAQRLWPDAHVHFFDDSYLAIDSAKKNYAANISSIATPPAFTAGDCLHNYAEEPFDLILCNPPFHQNHHVGDHIAQQMFRDGYQQISEDGYLCVVGNRHLAYFKRLQGLFGNAANIHSNAKFVVTLSQKCSS